MIEHIKEFLTFGNLIAGTIGAVIAWLISQRKSIKEISKLKGEIISIEVNLRKELFSIKNELNNLQKRL